MNRAQRRQAARSSRTSGPPAAPAVDVGAAADGAPGGPRPNAPAALEAAVGLHQAGNLIGAAEAYQRILDSEPDNARALNYLGVTAGALGQFETAARLMRRSIALMPEVAVFRDNLGDVHLKAGAVDEAEQAFRGAVEADAGDWAGWNKLGIALSAKAAIADAEAAFGRAIALRPDYAEAHNNLGNVFYIAGALAEAEQSYRRAIEARPDYARARNNLAATLALLDRFDDAEAESRRVIALQPDFAEAWNNLGGVLNNLGRLSEACDAYRRCVALSPGAAGAHSNLIYCMGLDGDVTGQQILAECHRWNASHGAPRAGRIRPHGNDADPGRRLRVGYVSADFRDHAVAHFLLPLLAAHDHDAVEIAAYADVERDDAVTGRFRALVDRWVPISGMTDEAVAGRIRSDAVDVLVDLAGHTAGNRLLAFAERPAPVQATWLGYGGTTGLDAMDYRLTDAVTDPEGAADADHSETLVRLPGGFLCYQPPSDAPPVAPGPFAAAGHVTFASFNNLSKVMPRTVALWARVLRAVPGARMIVKGRPFAEAGARRRYHEMFAAHGVDEGRLDLVAQLPSRDAYLDVYGRVDIVLDSFPYNGGTTTCEALWMGVPVVTLCGQRTVSRMGASMLARVGADDMAARSEDDYVAIAAGLAADPGRLARLRAGLRPRMQGSALCDAAGFARAMEAAYRDMWRRWCRAGGRS